MSRDFQFDVFLSHNSEDKPHVRALAERLKDDGVRVWFDEWEIKPGDDIFLKIEQGLESSRTLTLVMSPNCFGSDWVTTERNTILFRDPVNTQRRFIPLLIEECRIPDTIRRFRYIDWRDKGAEGYKELLATVKPAGDSFIETTETTALYRLEEVTPEVLEIRTRVAPAGQSGFRLSARAGETLLWQLFSFPNGGSPQKLLYADGILFVSNWGGSNIMLIDPKQRNVLGTVELDNHEAGDLALPTDRSKFGNSAVIRRYPPGDMVVAKRKLFVGQVFSEFVLVIDVDSRTIVKRIPVGGEGSLAASPDGRKVYFASNKTNEFYVIDSHTYGFEAIPYPDSGRGSGAIFAHPTSNTLYLGIQRGGIIDGQTLQGGNSFMAVYDLGSGKYIKTIYLAEVQNGVSDDSWPVCMTYSPDDGLLYVGMIQSKKGIYVIDTRDNSIVGNIEFKVNNKNRHFGWVDPLGQTIYGRYLLSVNRNNYELAVVDRESSRQLVAVPLGGSGNGPNHIVVVNDEAIISHSEYDGLIFVDLVALTNTI